MRTFLKILILAFILGIILGSCSRKNSTSKTVVNIVDSVRFWDSVRIKDSVRIFIKDSTIIREAVNTGSEVRPCEGKLKAFFYTLNRGNFKMWIKGDTTGLISWDINFDAEIAYREKIFNEYREHLKDSLSSIYSNKKETIIITKTITVKKTVWPWWVYGLMIVTAISLFLKFQYPIKSLYNHWFTKN